MKTTRALIEIATAIMAAPSDRIWGYELAKTSGVRSGALYPILHRMLAEEWLSDGWEENDPARKRPPRRYYELTERGARELGAIVSRAHSEAASRQAREARWAW